MQDELAARHPCLAMASYNIGLLQLTTLRSSNLLHADFATASDFLAEATAWFRTKILCYAKDIRSTEAKLEWSG